MGSRLQTAAIEGNVAMLSELLRQDPSLLDSIIVNGLTDPPLHVAALHGHTDFVDQILQRKPHLSKHLDSQGFSPLHLAAAKGHLEIMRLLLQVEVDTDLRSLCDADGRNPLHLAAMNGRVDALRELIGARSEAAGTPIGQPIDDSSLLNAKDVFGFTALHLAVSNKHIETVEFLVNIKGMEVNAVNSNGFTALDVLVQSNRDAKDLEIAELLREFGASRTSSVVTPASENGNQIRSRTKASGAPPIPISGNQSDGGCVDGRGHWLMRKREALMVVASVIATMAFQAAINPPGGIWQDAGKSIHPVRFSCFISSITFSFVFSIIELFLLIVIDYPSTSPFFLRFLSISKVLSIGGMIVAYGVSIACLT